MLKRTEVKFDPFRDGELVAAVPTTEAQKEMWGSIAADPDANLCYNESIRIQLTGSLNYRALEFAVNELLRRRDSLRGSFSPMGKSFMVAAPQERELERIDMDQMEQGEQDDALKDLKRSIAETPFDLEKGPLFKAQLIKLSRERHLLFISAHHLVCDGWSLSLIARDISVFYEDFIAGRESRNDLPIQFHEYALKDESYSEMGDYWRKEFETIPAPLELPLDYERPRFRTYNSLRLDRKLDKEIFNASKQSAGKNRCSVYHYLLSAFEVCLSQLGKSEDLVVGISVAGQANQGMEDLVGHLVHMLPIRARVKDNMSFKELLLQTKTKMLDASDNQNTTFGQILKHVEVPRDPSRIPLISAVFNVDQQYPGQGFEFKDLKALYVSNPRAFENFEIFINATVIGDECVLECQYNSNLFKAESIESWLGALEKCLEHFNKNVDAQIATFKFPLKPNATTKTDHRVKSFRNEVKESAISASSEKVEQAKGIWEDVMGVKGIPLDSNFFSIGGHSLLAVDICHRVLEDTGIKLTLKDLILHPTVREFARLLPDEGKSENAVLSSKGLADGLEEAELTLSQFQAWYQEQIHLGTTMHNLPSSIRVKSDLSMGRLERAYKKMLENYPSLRTSVQSGPVQKIESTDIAMEHLGLELVEGLDLEEVIKQMQGLALMPFDLTQAPLFRAKVFKLGEGDYVIFNCFHHIIFDGWSFDIFFQALSDSYEGKDLKPEGSRFLDYAKWQQAYLEGENYKKDLAYWMKKLSAPLPVLEMPTDFPRPAVIKPESASFSFEIDKSLDEKIHKFSERSGVSLFNVFLSCYQKTLMDYSQSEEVLVGIPVRGRNSSDQLNTIGYFVNAVAIRNEAVSKVKNFLERTQEEVGEALSHQNAPFEKVRESLSLKRDPSRPPLVQTFFSFQEVGNRSNRFDGAPYTQINLSKAAIHTDLDIWIKSGKNKIEGAIEYRKDLFCPETISRLQNYFTDLIAFVVNEQGEDWDDFRSPSLSNEIAKINDTSVYREDGRTIVDYVDEMASSSPNKVAVVAGKEQVTYSELSAQSSLMAARLSERGVSPGDLVGLCLERDEKMMVAILGVMKAGAGYVPLDPYFPQERLDYMVEQSGLKFMLANEVYIKRFTTEGVQKETVESIALDRGNGKKVSLRGDQTAYVIYTSGSTGKPKGVNISYDSMMNFLHSVKKTPGFGPDNKILAVTTLSFDISVLELFLPLIAGGSVYLARKEETIDGESLKETIESNEIDTLQGTPATLRILLAAGWKGSKDFRVLCGGEAFPRDLAESLIPICSSVWNMYGPTETAVWATCKKLEDHKGTILVGKPLENYSVYVLDEALRPVPFGAVGELFIGGEGVALGYYGRKDLTEERFLQDSVRGSGRMYKTGDLARFHANGELECLGRNDDQVKVRGYRIELGEIEASLAEIPEVGQCVVMAREDRPGDVRLVAYVIPKSGGSIDQFGIREKLSKKLPSYMVPVNYIEMKEFPLTLTGKVERKKLPPVDFEAVMEEEAFERRNQEGDVVIGDTEARLAKIWMTAIGVQDYDLEDDYFDVGGNSLRSIDFFAKISKEFSVDLPLATLISHSRFGQILELLEEKTKAQDVEAAQDVAPSFQEGAAEINFNIPAICSSIVPIKTSGRNTPVFCFHGVGGNILNYLKIAPAFGDRPLFGVQSRGVDGKSEPLKSVDEMAQAYMEEIRIVQPKGPYLFAGGSMGGLVAFETARKLKSSGQEVSSVIMLDTFGPGSNFSGYRSKGDYWSSLIFSLKWRLRRRLVRAQAAFLKTLGLPIPHEIRHFNVEVLNYQALWKHSPGEYDGSIDLVRAPISNNGWYSRPDMGWGKVVKGDIKTHFVEGEHANFVEAPKLPKVLENVLSSY